MGGSASEEFLAESEVGEDTFVRCLRIGLRRQRRGGDHRGAGAACRSRACPRPVVHDTADTPTIATLVDWANRPTCEFAGRRSPPPTPSRTCCSRSAQPGGEWELLAVGVPGDREVDDKRLGAALEPAEYALLDDADFARNPFLVKGYIGPKGLQANGVRFLVDPRIVDGTAWITGADEPGKHVVGLVAGRDFTADGTIEAAEVRDGDPSPDGAGPLVSRPRHRDRPHLPAGPQVHRRVHRRRARRGRQTGAADHGFLRYRRVPAGRGDRRTASRRARSALAVGGVAVRRAPGDRQQGRRGAAPGPTELAADLDRLGRGSAARRPQGLARSEVQGRRTARCAVDRRGRPRLGQRGGRTAQPVQRREPGDRRSTRRPRTIAAALRSG